MLERMPRAPGVILLSLLMAFVLATLAPLSRESPEVAVSTAQVTLGTIPHRIVSSGFVVPAAYVDVDVPGEIEMLAAGDESPVHAGQILARVNDEGAAARLEALKAVLAEDDAEITRLRGLLDERSARAAEAELLADRDLIVQSDAGAADQRRANAQSRLDDLEASRAAAQVNADASEVDVERSVVRSPVDGVVLSYSSATPGARGPAAFRIATDLTRVRVAAELMDRDADDVANGDVATLECRAGSAQGRVVEVTDESIEGGSTVRGPDTGEDVASRAQRMRTAVLEVSNEGKLFQPGMNVVVQFDEVAHRSVVRIPVGALAFRPSDALLHAIGEQRVPYVPVATQQCQRVQQVWKYNGIEFMAVGVVVGVTDREWAELETGDLSPGDVLVTSANEPPAAP